MSNKIFSWGLVLILVLAAGLRFYQLGQIPHGMTWDEAAIGYNGFAIFHTRRDEWLYRLPISFQSFGDYKAPLAIYLNGFFTAVFGMSLWAVRLPFALLSLAAIWGIILLVTTLSKRWMGLLAGLMLTLSPWHLHYSRAGFESGIAMTFFIWSLFFLTVYLQPRYRFWQFGRAILLAVASMYTYHSAKIVVPLFFIYWGWANFRQLLQQKIHLVGGVMLGGTALSPLIYDIFAGRGLERTGTTILDKMTGFDLMRQVAQQFLLHLSPQFLILGQTTTLRHGDGRWGVLLPTTLLLVVFGLLWGLKHTFENKARLQLFSLGWLLVLMGLLPAALGQEVPHSNRALLALPGFIMLAVVGVDALIKLLKASQLNQKLLGTHGEPQILVKSVLGTLVLLHLIFFIAYWGDYRTKFVQTSAADFKDGYLEAFSYVVPWEDQVGKILFTSDYGQPYIYALFVRQTNPIWYQGGSLIKYEFTDQIGVGDLTRDNTLVVAGAEDELDPERADHLVYGSDGQIRFKIYLPPKE